MKIAHFEVSCHHPLQLAVDLEDFPPPTDLRFEKSLLSTTHHMFYELEGFLRKHTYSTFVKILVRLTNWGNYGDKSRKQTR
jgi:hypothetical protein